jgi:hypothetical protein
MSSLVAISAAISTRRSESVAALQNRKRLVFPKRQTLPTVRTKRKILTAINRTTDHWQEHHIRHGSTTASRTQSTWPVQMNVCFFRLQRSWPLNWYPQDFNSYCYYGPNTNLQHVQLHTLCDILELVNFVAPLQEYTPNKISFSKHLPPQNIDLLPLCI